MADYIDRQSAMAALRKFAEECNGSTEAETAVSVAISVLSRVPSPWANVESTPPPGGKDVLFAIGQTDVFTGYCVGGRYYDSEGCGTYGVTHWMDRPDAPEVGTK